MERFAKSGGVPNGVARRLTGKQAAPRRPEATESRRRITGKQPVQDKVNTIRSVFEQLNRPGVERLKQALRSRGIPFKDQEVQSLVRGSDRAALPRHNSAFCSRAMVVREFSIWLVETSTGRRGAALRLRGLLYA